MHPSELPEHIVQRVIARRGRLNVFDRVDPKRTALVIIDMQNAFCAPDAALEVPVAREIVPNINRLAAATRAAGGMVVWVLMTIKDEADWPVFLASMFTKEKFPQVRAGLEPGTEGNELWKQMRPEPGDLVIHKNRFSAFLPSACDLPDVLRDKGIDTVLITGTLTNVCSEASARDAAMMNFKTIMVSDGNAGRSDEEHVATLVAFVQSFGDVRSTDDLVGLLRLSAS